MTRCKPLTATGTRYKAQIHSVAGVTSDGNITKTSGCKLAFAATSDCRRALDRVLDFRDKQADPNASGMPPAAIAWFYSEELPRLCLRADVRAQTEAHIQELLQQAAVIEAEISPQAAALQQRWDYLATQVDILEAAIGHD